MEVLKRIKGKDTPQEARNELHTLFNEQGFSDYMVVYLRLLTSGQLQKEEDFYGCFIEGHRTVCIIKKWYKIFNINLILGSRFLSSGS